MEYTVYILYSSELNTYYIGHTSVCLEIRIKKHLSNHRGFTSRAKDWMVIYTETYPEKRKAILREMELKAWKSKYKIETLIQNKSKPG